MASTDIVFLHFSALKKRRTFADELACLADALPAQLAAVFQMKAPQGEDISTGLRKSNDFPNAKVRFVPVVSVTLAHDKAKNGAAPAALELDDQSSLMIVDNKCVQFAVVADDGEEITDLLVQFKNMLASNGEPSISLRQENKATLVTFATRFSYIENVNEVKLPKKWMQDAKDSNAVCTFSIHLDSSARPADTKTWIEQALSSFEEWSRRVAETPAKAKSGSKTSVSARAPLKLRFRAHIIKTSYPERSFSRVAVCSFLYYLYPIVNTF